MAMSGIEIFKLLPKTNCKKCGQPTCLAFAMKLAQRQVSIDACPDVSEESRQKLSDASTPPIRMVTFGVGDRAIKMGEETVLFRHEKKYYHPCAISVEIKDTMTDEEISKTVADILDSDIERVGQRLRIDAVFLNNTSNDKVRFRDVVKLVSEKASGLPLILSTDKPDIADEALKSVADTKPLLYGVTKDNLESMCDIAKRYKIPVGIIADGLEEMSQLTERLKAKGILDMVIDTKPRSAKEILTHNTLIRRAAIKKGMRSLGYPIITFAQRDDDVIETLIASLGIIKYSSILVLSNVRPYKNLALFTLRQNIYTDPQVPMQVEQKIYKIGEPTDTSPLIVTTNFSLTYFIVSGEIENSKVPTRLAILDCEGLSVLTAWAAGKFTASRIANFIKESGIENELSRKEVIIPGYVAMLSGAIEDKLPGWKVTVGPREANALPAFLKAWNG
ncbi:MAG: acetyl-CoA decarbonylase/synthase complex subunit gamma [Thermodesulfovibrionales bacterium]|nr:acetyl-CoA decarbonylase/synthase complex subunit gamma [Thermodesulfovibrionales bacterium]